jgi:hypothetical protein
MVDSPLFSILIGGIVGMAGVLVLAWRNEVAERREKLKELEYVLWEHLFSYTPKGEPKDILARVTLLIRKIQAIIALYFPEFRSQCVKIKDAADAYAIAIKRSQNEFDTIADFSALNVAIVDLIMQVGDYAVRKFQDRSY